jgi:CRP-like cAMP-binding protein
MGFQFDYGQIKERARLAEILLGFGTRYEGVSLKCSQRDLASMGGTDWESTHKLLASFEDVGAIRFDRNKIIINKDLLQKAAGIIDS